MSNTLLNYFKKTPAKIDTDNRPNLETIVSEVNISSPIQNPNQNEDHSPVKKISSKKRSINDSSSKNKRRRIMILSDSEYDKENDQESNTILETHSDKMELEPEFVLKVENQKKDLNLKKSDVNQYESCDIYQTGKITPTKTQYETNSIYQKNDVYETDIKWDHLKYTWLENEKIKDMENRYKNDPNYDPKTLFVPESFKKDLTPGLRQWWEIKSKNYDVIVFFKVGKFYELYHVSVILK